MLHPLPCLLALTVGSAAVAVEPAAAADDGRGPGVHVAELTPDLLPAPVLRVVRGRLGSGEILWRTYRRQVGDDAAYAVITDDEALLLDPSGAIRERRELRSDGLAGAAGTVREGIAAIGLGEQAQRLGARDARGGDGATQN